MKNNIKFVPDSIFFVKSILLPENLSDADLLSYIETSIENFSPFPIEQMRYGFTRKNNIVTVFTTTNERLSKLLTSNDETIIPQSLPFFLGNIPDGWVLLTHDNSSSMVLLKNSIIEDFVPNISGDIDSESKRISNQNISSSFKITNIDTSNLIFFRCDLISQNETQKLKIKKSISLKYMDLRTASQLKTIAKKKRSELLLFALPRLILLCLIIMILLQLYLWGKSVFIYTSQPSIDQKIEIAKEVDNLNVQLNSLKKFSAKENFNILLLAEVNASRPSNVDFQKVNIEDSKKMEISARTDGIEAANKFAESLKNLNKIKSVRMDSPSSRSGEVKFLLHIEFK